MKIEYTKNPDEITVLGFAWDKDEFCIGLFKWTVVIRWRG